MKRRRHTHSYHSSSALGLWVAQCVMKEKELKMIQLEDHVSVTKEAKPDELLRSCSY